MSTTAPTRGLLSSFGHTPPAGPPPGSCTRAPVADLRVVFTAPARTASGRPAPGRGASGRRAPRCAAPAPVSAATVPALVLIDAENQAAAGSGLDEVVSVCRRLAGPDAVLVAAVSAQNAAAFTAVCAKLGVKLILSDDATSAADRSLLAVARTAKQVAPGTRIVVASGDHAFASLHPDVVVSRNPDGVSSRLAACAGDVVLLRKEARS